MKRKYGKINVSVSQKEWMVAMSGIKGFWNRLFTSKEQKSADSVDALVSTKGASIVEELKADYGIEIVPNRMLRNELVEKGYRIILPDEIGQATAVFQYLPQFAAFSMNNQAVASAFKNAVEGSFWVKLAPGSHLAASKVTPNAFRGIGLSNATNQVASSAELIQNTATLTMPTAPQVALSVFSAVSFATGQYFMTQINGKLEAIASGVDRIEEYLEDSRRGVLIAACQEINELVARIDYISNDNDANNMVLQLTNIRYSVRAHISHYQKQIAVLAASMTTKDKENEVANRINKIAQLLAEYRYTVQLVSMTKYIELRIRNVLDPNEIDLYRKEMAECIDMYKADHQKYSRLCCSYLEQNHALNKLSIRDKASIGALGFLDLVLINTPKKTLLAIQAKDSFDEKRAKRKAELQESAEALMPPLGADNDLDILVNAVDTFLETLKKPIEIVKVEDDYYTNIPSFGPASK